MYSNIGAKVKGLAVFVCVIGIVGSLIAAIVMWANDLVGAGFGTLIGGCLSAWIGSWVVYCIGDTNVKTTELLQKINSVSNRSEKRDPSETIEIKSDNRPENPKQDEHFNALPVKKKTQKCPHCGAACMEGLQKCWNCGTPFVRNTEGN